MDGGQKGYVQGREVREVKEEVNDKGRERRKREKNEVAKEKREGNNEGARTLMPYNFL
jgi:hypothetical protein